MDMATEPGDCIHLTTDLREKGFGQSAPFPSMPSIASETLQAFFKRMILETLIECLDGCIEDWHQYDPDDEETVIPMINANMFKARIEEKLWRMKHDEFGKKIV
jgi:hypothetical protein